VIHLDETRALEPLARTSEWEAGEPPETYPFGVEGCGVVRAPRFRGEPANLT
jgi:hypothetical protein